MINIFILFLIGALLALIDSLDIIIYVVLFNILKNKNYSKNYPAFVLTYLFWALVHGIIILIFGKSFFISLGFFENGGGKSLNLIIGLVIIGYAIYLLFKKEKNISKKKYTRSSIIGHAILATIISIIGIPESFIYFGYLLEVISQRINTLVEVTAFLIYNLFFFLPYLLLFKAYKKYGESAQNKVEKILKFFSKYKITEIILILIGLSLIIF